MQKGLSSEDLETRTGWTPACWGSGWAWRGNGFHSPEFSLWVFKRLPAHACRDLLLQSLACGGLSVRAYPSSGVESGCPEMMVVGSWGGDEALKVGPRAWDWSPFNRFQ